MKCESGLSDKAFMCTHRKPTDDSCKVRPNKVNTSRSSRNTAIDLDAFLGAAEEGQLVTVKAGKEGPVVIALGRTQGGRRVAWIDDSDAGSLPPAMATASAAFLAALEGSYGAEIRNIIEREFDLPRGAAPLPSALVKRAVRLANASQSMFAGSNFMTKLQLSARAGGAPFVDACERLNIKPASMGPGRRALADALFGQAFDEASRNDTVRVPEETAVALFEDALSRASKVDEANAAALADASDDKPQGGGSA